MTKNTMKPNKILLIITTLCIMPLLIMSTNNEVKIVGQLAPIKTTKTNNNKDKSTVINQALGLTVNDTYFDIKIKVPNYTIKTNNNQNVVITAQDTVFVLDQKATEDLTKYTVNNLARITKIVIKN